MKKTLLALAAIAASSAAFAQSSVTLYGIADVSLESVKTSASTTTRVTSGNLSTSRFGLKGVEDIGGGLKAIFQLESAIALDTGANGGGSTRFFDRNAYVGLTSGYGTVRLGRDDTLIGLIAAGPLATNATYDELRLLPTRAADSYRRADNSITYVAPTLVPGLSLAAQYSTAALGVTAPVTTPTAIPSAATTGTEGTTNGNLGKSYGLSANYVAGPLSAGVGYLNIKDAVSDYNLAGNQKANATLVYGAYDFGAAKVTAYYDAETSPAASALATSVASNKRLSVLGTKVAVPVTPELTVVGGFAVARNVKGNVAGDDNAQVFTLRGLYALSKRTTAYALFTNVNNDTNTNLAVGGVTGVTDKTARGLAVGVRHAF